MNQDFEGLRVLEDELGPGMLFARGFLVSTSAPDYVPTDWVRASDPAPGTELWHDPRVPSVACDYFKTRITVVGEIYSLDAPREGPEAIVAMLARERERSLRRFYDALDGLHGRFAIFVASSAITGLQVFHDATGLRTVYFSVNGRVVASHPALVASNTGASPRMMGVRGYGSPGLATPYTSVSLLPPNQMLDLHTGSFSRYWPRRRIRTRPLEEIIEVSSGYLRASLRGVLERHPRVLASLTAGTDSRVTLATALTMDVADRIEFFTYAWNNNKWIDRADQRIASELARNLNLRHSLINLDAEPEGSPAFKKMLALNAHREHSRTLAAAYHRLYAGQEIIHVRSNLSEIMRTFYLKKKSTPRPRSGRDMSEIYRRSISKGLEPTPDAWKAAEDEFDSMFEKTGFRRASRKVDGRDLFYWEHRMGSWHGQVVLESDTAFETVSLYNSRRLITTMLSAAIDQRMDDAHMRGIIATAPGDLMKYRFNPGPKRVMSDRTGATVLMEERKAARLPAFFKQHR